MRNARSLSGGAGDMERGFTLVELLMVVVIMAVMFAFTAPMLRVSPQRRVQTAARQLARDLDLTRTRAMATKAIARLAFDSAASTYIGYLDHDADGSITQIAAETQELGGFGQRELGRNVVYGRGNATAAPGDTMSGAITFSNSRIEFDSRGVTLPFGTRGTIYLTHSNDADAVTAVSISGSASFKVWIWRGSSWE
jgi:type II secretion system protein H